MSKNYCQKQKKKKGEKIKFKERKIKIKNNKINKILVSEYLFPAQSVSADVYKRNTATKI